MRITRAAKVAAFPLIVLALVALIACQGAPGTKGDKGDTGDMGDMGTSGQTGDPGDPGDTGDTGDPGIDTLTARGTGPLAVYINDGKAANDTAVIGPLPDPIDMSTHFRGGYEPVTYAAGDMVANSSGTFTGAIDKDTGVLTITLRVAGIIVPPPMGYEIDEDNVDVTASVITVTATDAEGNKADRAVHILTNKAPTIGGNVTDVWSTSVGTEMRADKKVVACQVATLMEVADTDTAHQCTVDAGMTEFEDDGDFDLSVVKTNSKVSVTAAGKKLTLTGLSSTWDEDANAGTGADVPAVVTIRATDKNDLYVERTLQVSVDTAPTVKRQIQNRTIKDDATLPVIVARKIVDFFDDTESTLMVGNIVTPTSSDMGTATAAVDDDHHLAVTLLNPGTTMITVTIMEAAGFKQTVSQTFMVTVINANP